MRQRPQCATYLRELKAKTLSRHLHAKDRIIGELATVAFANFWDYIEPGPDGLTAKPLEELPPTLRRAVAGLSVSRTYYGGTIRLRMHDKIRALDKLIQLFGLNDPASRADDKADALEMSPVERAQRLTAILRMAKTDKTETEDGGAKEA